MRIVLRQQRKDINDFLKRIGHDRLDQIAFGAQLVGFFDIVGFIRRGQDHNRQVFEFPLFPLPGQDVVTRSPGQIEIEQNKAREGVKGPVGILAFTGQISHSFITVGYDLEGIHK